MQCLRTKNSFWIVFRLLCRERGGWYYDRYLLGNQTERNVAAVDVMTVLTCTMSPSLQRMLRTTPSYRLVISTFAWQGLV